MDGDAKQQRNAFTLVHRGRFDKRSNREWALRVTNEKYIPGGNLHSVGDTTRLHLFLGYGWFNGSTELADGEWHHVAVRHNGSSDEHGVPSVDGRPEKAEYGSEAPPKPLDIDTKSAGARSLGIAFSRSGRGPPFKGEIDEL